MILVVWQFRIILGVSVMGRGGLGACISIKNTSYE